MDLDDGELIDWDDTADELPAPNRSGTIRVVMRETSELPDLDD